ncbi:hypothetical protein M408DRAFT_203404 [Serendipita vermifera MAFF 305830]|uniref:Uncharacterized protein n=1 Tax=Serendipita vermifera MAFF 305830 TaxID=933852 RepID=A0A0C3B2K0_SERVB|nr:hypothetical protein M408DRAFT_203404 [Serendipita vermifera MAFF 305830]
MPNNPRSSGNGNNIMHSTECVRRGPQVTVSNKLRPARLLKLQSDTVHECALLGKNPRSECNLPKPT